jgi:hypothetical protein
MKNIQEYTTDELITELRKRDEGYFVGLLPISNIGNRFNDKLSNDDLDIIQSEFMESPHLDDTLEYVLDFILENNLVESN